MAQFFIGRTVVPNGSDFDVTGYFYDTVTGPFSMGPTTQPYDPGGNIEPATGAVVFAQCNGTTLEEYTYDGPGTYDCTLVSTPNSPTCCSLNVNEFNFTVGADDGSDNGSITIVSPTLDEEDYEYSLNNGAWVAGTAGSIVISGITGDNDSTQNVRLRLIGGTCFVSMDLVVPRTEQSAPPFALNITEPAAFVPVFYDIAYTAVFENNEVTVKQVSGNTVIETDDTALQAYLATLPNIRVYGSAGYNGVYRVLSQLATNQFVISATYSADETVTICPSDKQIFHLYCERDLNQFVKIAELAIAADASGLYTVRVEGFLQSEFVLNHPVEGDEITLGRKFYLVARDFAVTTTITTAVYSAVESLTQFIEDLTPLGPAPLNFVNEQTQKGVPVLFSYLNQTTGRVVNIISSKETDIITTNDVNLSALPCNQYSIQWIKISGAVVGPLSSVPALPSWITAAIAGNQVNLEIDTCGGSGGDYEPDDYLSEDYLTAGFNELTGCYEFEISDAGGLLFTLSICIYPIQQPATEICTDDVYNIAWINREGGWSSYAFGKDKGDRSRKQLGYDVGGSKDYKRNGELKKSEVQDVYANAAVSFSNKNQRELIFIASLRRSIQAYLWNESTLAWDIPIFIDVESFPTYSLPFNQAQDGNGSFTFRYSNEIRVQRQ